MNNDALVIGLTGSFGSGCSTLGEALRSRKPNDGFAVISLSTALKNEWKRSIGSTAQAEREPTRRELQDFGNELRASQGRDVLARAAVDLANRENSGNRVVFDSIRNLGEVDFFRQSFPRFFLVAVQCSSDQRWKRVERHYKARGLGDEEFRMDDIRDQIESDLPHGQQVQLCVDDADIVISNQQFCHSRQEAIRVIRSRAEPYLGLITKERLRYPSVDEIMMSVAYIHATQSRCIKRQVGAVIVDDDDNIVSVAYNENPPPIDPCQPREVCEKDSKMLGKLESLEGTDCPRCGKKVDSISAPYICAGCRISFKEVLFPDRGMQWCPAIHAEDAAIRQAPRKDLRDCTLYTTTFPCFNCAKAITYAGIKRVVYVEPYPDGDGADLLEKAGRDVLLFEGVKARAFHRLFAPIQTEMEKQYGMQV